MATTVTRKKLTIDAAGRSIGRVATEAAKLLQGKHKPEYEPQRDHGDFVEVRNAAKVNIIGANKPSQKTYYHYSGYPGGMKSKTLKDVMAKNPAEAVERAVQNMLPKNRLQKERMKRLRVKND